MDCMLTKMQVAGIPEGQYIDSGLNNGRQVCTVDSLPTTELAGNGSSSEPSPTEATAMNSLALGSDGKCAPDGLFADPDDCRGFVKCAQVILIKKGKSELEV
jgi:hypothetical protein